MGFWCPSDERRPRYFKVSHSISIITHPLMEVGGDGVGKSGFNAYRHGIISLYLAFTKAQVVVVVMNHTNGIWLSKGFVSSDALCLLSLLSCHRTCSFRRACIRTKGSSSSPSSSCRVWFHGMAVLSTNTMSSLGPRVMLLFVSATQSSKSAYIYSLRPNVTLFVGASNLVSVIQPSI